MEWKYINTNGIEEMSLLDGTAEWYWGMDWVHGDLYEAQELYENQHHIQQNRLIFIKYPEGTVYEPIQAEAGQYFGLPVYYEQKIYCLLVDFPKKKILIYQCAENMEEALVYASLDLEKIVDCYNLNLAVSPLMLIRQGDEKQFQVLWPEQISFPIAATESFVYRDGERLLFSKWSEEETYYEEIVVRDYFSGTILECMRGILREMPDGQKWVLK